MGRSARICLNGHDTTILGRNSRRRCIACANEWEKRNRPHGTGVRAATGCACVKCEEKRERVWQITPSLPTSTMLAYIPIAGGSGTDQYENFGGVSSGLPMAIQQKWYRACKVGLLTPLQADAICSYLGVPTSSVYPKEWMA